MSDTLGQAAVRFAFRYLRRRYRREIRIGIGVAAVAIGVAAYWRRPQRPRGLSRLAAAAATFLAIYRLPVSGLGAPLASNVPWCAPAPDRISSPSAPPWRCSAR